MGDFDNFYFESNNLVEMKLHIFFPVKKKLHIFLVIFHN